MTDSIQEAPSLSLGVRFAQRIVSTKVALFVIGLNTLLFTLLAFEDLSHVRILDILDEICLIYFVIEAALKIWLERPRGYFKDAWNRFDFLIVLVSFPSLLIAFIPIPDLSFLLVLRVLRVARFFRALRFIPNIGRMLDGVRRAIRTSGLVMIAFLAFCAVISLISCHLFHEASPEHFRNPLVAFYSIFRIFTLEGWYEIPDAIAAKSSMIIAFFTRLYFMGVVVSGGIFGLSIVNALFVDEMLRDENDKVEENFSKMEEQLHRLEEKLERLLEASENR